MREMSWRLAAGSAAIAAIAAAGAAWPLQVDAAGASVSMKENPPGCPSTGYCFTPASTTVGSGEAVTWTNMSDTAHTVTRCTASACNGVGPGSGADTGPSSGQVGAGQTFSMTFNGAGTYNYYCTVHGYAVMHGTVTVNAASASTGSSTSSSSSSGSMNSSSSSSSGSSGSAVTAPSTGADLGWIPAGALVTAGAAMLGGALAVRRRSRGVR